MVTRLEPLLSIIVPVYNERATIGAVLERLLSIDLPIAREIIAVDDGSVTGPGQNSTPLPLAVHSSPLSTSNATEARAWRCAPASHARRDDRRHPGCGSRARSCATRRAGRALLRNEADVVYGSRFMHGSSHVPFMTRAGNRSLTILTNALYGSSLTDMETCYKIMRGDLARSLPLTANRFDIEPEITVQLLKSGARIIELPVTFSPRSTGSRQEDPLERRVACSPAARHTQILKSRIANCESPIVNC
jgi:cellulose synthase/poly-beta-1,6-N-acetylglucosamine synthase-like glycosyltransferase